MENFVYHDRDAQYYINGDEPDENDHVYRPEWEINPELRKAVYENMPFSLSPEAKAMFIYFRLCNILKYDENYMYNELLTPEQRRAYDTKFYREYMEAITPNSVITCYDFGRIYCKFLQEFKDNNIVPIFKLHGINRGHASTGFYTKNATVELDPILLTTGKQTNDLLNLKMGVLPDGIDIIFQKHNIITEAIQHVYPFATQGEKPSSFQYRLLELKELSRKKAISEEPREEEKLTLGEKLKAFFATLKEKRIIGNEAVQLLINYNKYGFFDDRLKIALCAKKQEESGRRNFIRKALIRIDDGDNSIEHRDKYDYFLLDTHTLDLAKVDPSEISSEFISGLYRFESERQEMKMPEIR